MTGVRYSIVATLLLSMFPLLLAGCPKPPAETGVVLSVTPAVLDFGTAEEMLSFDVTKNAVERPMAAMTVSSPQSWIVVEACLDTADNCVSRGPLDEIRIPVRVDRDKMELGANTGAIYIESTGAATQTIEVLATNTMIADFAVDNRTPEVGQSIQFVNRSVVMPDAGPVTGVEWYFGDGTDPSTDLHPTHTYAAEGTYTVSLTMTTTKRSARAIRQNYINVVSRMPKADFSASSFGVFQLDPVTFTDLSDPGSSPIVSWLWSFGDGGTSAVQNPVYKYATPGLYSVSLTVTTARGANTVVKTNSMVVQERVAPRANFRIDTLEPLANSPVQFTNLSDPGTGSEVWYEWTFGDGLISNEASPSHVYTRPAATPPGAYTVTLTIRTEHGTDSFSSLVSPAVTEPVANFRSNVNRALTNDTVQFLDTSVSPTTRITGWEWNFGDPASGSNTSTLRNPSHQYARPGAYSVTLTVSTAYNSAKVTKQEFVHVFEPRALDRYVRAPDESYGYQLVETVKGVDYKAHVIRMISQRWRMRSEVDSTLWQHWLTIVEPNNLRSGTAMLFISGGDTDSEMPDLQGTEATSLLLLARESGTVVALLEQVPNQPLTFADEEWERSEDDLIAYTLDRFRQTGDETWPALLPMVKSAVRGMDTVQDFMASQIQPVEEGKVPRAIEKFVVSGASKRGWTTWLTAAVDARVTAIAPLVFDVLNMDVQMAHQKDVYGYYSEAVYPYVEMNVFNQFDTPSGQQLLQIIDPYEYRDRLIMPKLLISSTGDEFFLPDSAQFYFNDLLGDNRLAYMPNTNHGLGDYNKVIKTLLPWYQAQIDGVTPPELTWNVIREEGRIVVETSAEPESIKLWSALSPNRDFRLNARVNPETPSWFSTTIPDSDIHRYVAQVPWPDNGWTGFTVELSFASPYTYLRKPNPYTFTTEVGMMPDSMPPHTVYLPEAEFTAAPQTPPAGGIVEFTDQSSSPVRPIVRWFWQFGDGTFSVEPNPQHVYATLGAFDVALTVYNVHGYDTIEKQDLIIVEGTKIPPAADFAAADTTPNVFESVQFTDESEPGSAPIRGWSWNFGDGSVSYLQNPQHTYKTAGLFTVSLTVITDDGTDIETKTDYIEASVGDPLESYVAAEDDAYGYTVDGVEDHSNYRVHRLRLTSQQWRSSQEVSPNVWQHWLTIVEADRNMSLPPPKRMALLFVDGGSITAGPPNVNSGELADLVDAVVETGSVLVHLQGVPNEPLHFADEPPDKTRTEDAIISYTFDKYLDSVAAGSPDPFWPLLLPMAKSAVKAMDATQDYLLSARGRTVDGFVVSGGSKRGWTTWMTAAADPKKRVVGIMPLVIDVLNMEQQMNHHRNAYGYWSPAIYEYAQMRVFERLGTPGGDMLLDIVDPFSYRDKLTMPKLIMNSTGDQFFLPDSSRFYLNQMPGENHLHYVPNSDHGLNSDALTMNTILSFYASFLFDLGRPEFTWTFEGTNTIRVRPETPPKEAWLWQAYSDPAVTDPHGPVGRRDFRLDAIGAAWTKTALPEQGNGDFIGQVTVPAQGWRAFFVQLVYEESTAQISYAYTTSVRVVPDTYPQFESYRTSVGIGADEIPVCVLYGQEGDQSAYQLGVDYGTLMRAEIQAFVPQFLAGVQASEPAVYSNGALDAAWVTTSPYADARYLDEMEGLAAGAQVPIETIRRAHMVPVLGSFSCSSVAAWGEATASGRLLQTRDLDWDLEAGAHDFPCLTMYIPQESDGVPHVNVGFAGLIGCQTGMNLGGIVVSEMGDSPDADRPFDVNGNHFMPMLREVLYDSLNLSEAIAKIYDTQRIKKYHYVIGDGRNYEAAVKIKAHEPDPLVVYTDNDPNDPNAPDNIFTDVVYNDEGRGAATFIDTYYGALDYLRMAEIANALAIHGSNVLNVVYDATGGEEAGKITLPLWVSYAQGAQEAYLRAPEDYVRFDMQAYLP